MVFIEKKRIGLFNSDSLFFCDAGMEKRGVWESKRVCKKSGSECPRRAIIVLHSYGITICKKKIIEGEENGL